MACIEPSSVTVGADLNCVYLKRSMTNSFVESKDEFLLCSLGSTNLNAILRFYFKEGEVLHFRIKGTGTIHLTGFLLESPEKNDEMNESAFEEAGCKKVDPAVKKTSVLSKFGIAAKN